MKTIGVTFTIQISDHFGEYGEQQLIEIMERGYEDMKAHLRHNDLDHLAETLEIEPYASHSSDDEDLNSSCYDNSFFSIW